jgi:drug/metabolite transporter (DMT)-like permease
VPAAGQPGLASVGLNVVANLAFMRSLRLSPLTATIPLLSLTPVFTSLVSMPMLGQRLGGRNWLGVALVVAGALLLNLRGGDAGSLAIFLRALRREPGVPYMAFTALLWSITPPVDKLAMDRATAPLHALILNLGVAVAMLAMLVATRRLAELRDARGSAGVLAVAVVCAFVGLAGQLAAFRVVPVGLFETIKRGIGFVMAMLTGRLILKEPVTTARWRQAPAAGVGLIVLEIGRVLASELGVRRPLVEWPWPRPAGGGGDAARVVAVGFRVVAGGGDLRRANGSPGPRLPSARRGGDTSVTS